MVFDKVAVGVPVVVVMRAAGVELDEGDTALDEATGEEAFFAKVGGDFLVHAVEGFGGIRFLCKFDRFGCSGLHLVGEFVAGDAGGEVGVAVAVFEVVLVELVERLDEAVLFVAAHAVGVFEIENGVAF